MTLTINDDDDELFHLRLLLRRSIDATSALSLM